MYTDGQYLENNQTWHVEDSPWKANNILKIMTANRLHPKLLVEVGCGAGAILDELSQKDYLQDCKFVGYDISPQAVELAKHRQSERVIFCQTDLFQQNSSNIDVLLAIDVFEHIPDYMGFLSQCKSQATFKIYHVPLEIHVSSVMRNTFNRARHDLGHIHYFTADLALAALQDTGHEIIDYFYTNSALDLFRFHPNPKTAIANLPRWIFGQVNLPMTARIFGGYSLLILAK